MDFALLGSVAGFALASCGTPGPNNMLLTSSATHFGYAPTLKLLLGIMLGMGLLMLLTALGLGQLFVRWPIMQWTLKGVGSGYLLWLAWQVATASGPSEHSSTPNMRWHQGALFQFLNPKAWLMAVSAISGFTLSGEQYWFSAWMVVLIFFALGMVTGHLWAFFGLNLRRWLHTPQEWRYFNQFMGLITAASVLMIWY